MVISKNPRLHGTGLFNYLHENRDDGMNTLQTEYILQVVLSTLKHHFSHVTIEKKYKIITEH